LRLSIERKADLGLMTNKTVAITDLLYDYLVENSLREPEILGRLREANVDQPRADFQIPPEQGQFMQLLTRAMGFRRAIEVGVFTGYSSLSVALAMPHDGRMIACDLSEEYTRIARGFWERAGVGHKIELRLGPALQTLDAMIAAGEAGSYDFVFIDADKANYIHYYERAVTLVRTGGLIGVDNTLWYGYVADPTRQDADTNAIRALNRRVLEDDRVHSSLLPIADGLTLALKLG
jgi:predicted O-methyltransferase YrrM